MQKISLQNIFIKNTVKPVLGLGITTTIGYGTLYYSITIMSEELAREFLWSKSFIFGILSLGILLGGFVAPIIGRFLDKHGARTIMSIGSVLCAIGLFGLSLIETKVDYILALLFLEVVSVLVLYEAAFVACSQLAGVKARLPIIQITLMAGFASTIFWPFISYLLTFISWREVYKILALLHICIALPIHYYVLNAHLKVDNKDLTEENFNDCICIEGKTKKKSFILLTIAFSLIAIPVTAMQTQFLAIFKGFGIEATIAVTLGAIIGPSQVIARIVDMIFSKKSSPMLTAVVSVSIMVCGLIALLFSGYDYTYAFIFVVFYGAGQGLTDIVRGTLPLYLYGKDGYGKTTGGLNLFRLLVTAMVPFGFAYILETFGVEVAVWFLIFVTIIAVILLRIIQKDIKRLNYGI